MSNAARNGKKNSDGLVSFGGSADISSKIVHNY